MPKEKLIQVTELEFDNMKHSIGYTHSNVHGGRFVIWRNFFVDNNSSRSKKEWKRLIDYGYVETMTRDTDASLYYRITSDGLSFMERMLGVPFVKRGNIT